MSEQLILTREEVDSLTLVLIASLYFTFRLGRWMGRRAEQRDLFRIISAQRITSHKEQ